MDFKAESLDDALRASKLQYFPTDRLISTFVASGLSKGGKCLMIPREQTSRGCEYFACFLFEEDQKKASFRGFLNHEQIRDCLASTKHLIVPLFKLTNFIPPPAPVLQPIADQELVAMAIEVEQKQKQKPGVQEKKKKKPQAQKEFTLEQAREGVIKRVRALKNPGVHDEFTECSSDHARVLDEVSLKVAVAAAQNGVSADIVREWLAAEARLARSRAVHGVLDQETIIKQMSQQVHGAVTVWSPTTAAVTFSGGQELRKSRNAPSPELQQQLRAQASGLGEGKWIGPVDFERVPLAAMRSHNVLLHKGTAWFEAQHLGPDALIDVLRRAAEKRCVSQVDARLRALIRLWVALWTAGAADAVAAPLATALPQCMSAILEGKIYPRHEVRRIAVTVLTRLGYKDIPRLVMQRWARQIEQKHGDKAQAKKKEVEHEVRCYTRGRGIVSSCASMCQLGLCPYYSGQGNLQTAVVPCFGAAKSQSMSVWNPVVWVQGK